MKPQSMMDKILAILRELAGEVGQTAKELWPHAVNNFQWDAISMVICGLCILIVGIMIGLRFNKMAKAMDAGDGRDACVVLGICTPIVGVLTAFPFIFKNLADAIEPTGGLLRMLLQ